MAFKVTEDYTAQMERVFKISIGTGKATRVETLEEASAAMGHYFGKEHDRNICPFCKARVA